MVQIALGQQIVTADQDIRDLVGAFKVGARGGKIWEFPAQLMGDGCLGSTCVSRYAKELLTDPPIWLAAHVTFHIPHLHISRRPHPNEEQQVVVSLTLEGLHFTTRSQRSQHAMIAGGPPNVESPFSSHRGAMSAWLHDTSDLRLGSMAPDLGKDLMNTPARRLAARDDLSKALVAYSQQSLRDLAPRIVATVEENILRNLGRNGFMGEVVVNTTLENWT